MVSYSSIRIPIHLGSFPQKKKFDPSPPNWHNLHLIRLLTNTRLNDTAKSIVRTQRIPSRSLNLTVRQTATQMNQRPGTEEENQNRSQDAKTVSRHKLALLPVDTDVEEGVRVPALGFVGDVCDAEVEQEYED